MSLIDSHDLAMMRADQTDALWDTCVVQTQSVTVDTYGQGIETFTDGTAIACRFVPSSGREIKEITRRDGTITIIRAIVRLPRGTTVTPNDRIKITKRFGETLTTPLVYAVAGVAVEVHGTCLTVDLMDVD
jgi:head-tail adaptor